MSNVSINFQHQKRIKIHNNYNWEKFEIIFWEGWELRKEDKPLRDVFYIMIPENENKLSEKLERAN